MVMIADDLRKWLLLLFMMTGQVKEVVKLEPPSLLGRVIRLTVKTAFWGECMFLCLSSSYTYPTTGGCLYGAYRITRGPVSRLLLVR